MANLRSAARAQVERVQVPGILGMGSAGDVPDVRSALAGLESPKPRRVAAARREALGAAKTAASKGSMRRKLGRGGLGAGALLLLAPMLFGKKDGIDPAIQMALAQQMSGAGQDGGHSSSKTLTDVGKLLAIIKSLQGLANVQGPVQKPRLI